MADPMVDDVSTTLPLELYVVTFEAPYYSSNQGTSIPLILCQRRANCSTGRKKLKQVEAEIQRLTTVRHQNLISVFAVKLNIPHSSGPPQLMVLSEQGPALTLHDVLQDCDSLREERASDYLGQILSGLNAVHGADLVHRGAEVCILILVLAHDSLIGINAGCIGLASKDTPSSSKLVKLGRVAYHTRLLDLHRSNSFGPHTPPVADEPQISHEWCVHAAPPGHFPI